MRIGLVGLGRIGDQHAATLRAIPTVTTLVVADADPTKAAAMAAATPDVEAAEVDRVLDADLDGLVIATGSMAHAEWVRRSVAAGVATFCEKPLATTMAETVELAELVIAAEVPVHVGFMRRFDAGYRAARSAVSAGEIGWVHTIRACTNDQSPPHPDFIPTSGGILRDCSIHDVDAIRFVTGREVVDVVAVGANKGAEFFAAGDDVDTAAALLTLDDGTLATLTATRYNGAGHDVRMEVMGERGTLGVGYDDSLAVRSVQAGTTYPAGPTHRAFIERFRDAFTAELTAFVEVASGRLPSPCTVQDALAAFAVVEACDLSRRTGTRVAVADLLAGRSNAVSHPTPETEPASA